MQCTSFIPVYYQPRSVNGAASGFPWHLLNSNPNYGDQRGFNGSLPPSTIYQYSSYDKEAMRQIIQNHEAMFRYQVQELHRLYKRQRELMDETRMRENAVQHLLLQTSESIQCISHPRSDISQTSHTPSWLLGDHSHSILEQTKNSCNEVDFLSLRSEENGKRILDLELPADAYCADEGHLCNAANKLQRTSDSEIGSSNSRRINCLIDLNEPVQLKSLSSNSTGGLGIHDGFEEVKPDSLGSDERNLAIAIDLNSMPVCFPETETAHENLNEENSVVPDKCIDLNTGVVEDMGLEGSLHPEYEEYSLRQNTEEKPPLDIDVMAAQTLIVISSSRVEDCTKPTNPGKSSATRLDWFADIVSNLENDVTKLQNEIQTDDFRTGTTKASERSTAVGKERRNAGRKGCPKLRKRSSDKVKKSTSSVLKQPATRSRQGVLQSWGKIRKRERGNRRRTSKFLAIN